MVIRNRGTTIGKGGFIWLPKPTAIYKLIVERTDGTQDNITDLINYVEIEDGVSESIGRFEFELWDPAETYVNAWSGNEIVYYYSNYASSATTLRFRGRAEKVVATGNKVKITGRNEALKIMNITVTKQYEETECSEILKDLFDNYATDFTYTNITTSGETLTVNWYQKPFFECVNELIKATKFDFYIDASLDVHFFEAGSITNDNEAIIHDQNLLEVGEFGKDLSLIRNRIIVYGAENEGVQTLYTAEDFESQNRYGVKEEVISDSNITSYDQAEEYAENLLEDLKDPPDVGDVKGILLGEIQPGERIWISSPPDNLHPKNYEIISYKHRIDNTNGEMSTTVSVSKEPRNITHVLKSMINTENKLKSTSLNPEEMRHSWVERFDSDSGTHSNTEIDNGYLKLASGKTSGYWVSSTRILSSSATEAYLLLNGEVLDDVVVKVSVDNGITYNTITRKEKITFTAGKYLKIKIEFSNSSSKADSIGVYYK